MDTIERNQSLTQIMRAATLRDRQEHDLADIARMLNTHGPQGLLKLVAEACEDRSELENDDMEICAQRIGECIESLNDELDVEIVSEAEIISENRYNDNRRF